MVHLHYVIKVILLMGHALVEKLPRWCNLYYHGPHALGAISTENERFHMKAKIEFISCNPYLVQLLHHPGWNELYLRKLGSRDSATWRFSAAFKQYLLFDLFVASSWLKTSFIRQTGSRGGATWRFSAAFKQYLLIDLLFASSWLKTNYIRKSGSRDGATWRFSEVFKQYLLFDLFVAASWQRTSWCRWTDRCFAVWPTWRPSPSMATRSGQSPTLKCKQTLSLFFLF